MTNYKYCSWDVGIKNLAFCVINKSDNGYEIEHWNLLNLITDNIEKLKCCCTNKNGKVCTSNALFSFDNIGYCKKHKGSYIPNIDNEYMIKNTDEHICDFKSNLFIGKTYG